MCAFFFFNDTATTEIYTLSLHDALPISREVPDAVEHDHVRGAQLLREAASAGGRGDDVQAAEDHQGDRKSTRLNSSHANISYAVFCLKTQPASPRPPALRTP